MEHRALQRSVVDASRCGIRVATIRESADSATIQMWAWELGEVELLDLGSRDLEARVLAGLHFEGAAILACHFAEEPVCAGEL